MCGVIGFCTDKVNNKQQEILYALMQESKVRGLHSFGIACYGEFVDYIATKKWFAFPSKEEVFQLIVPKLIWHNRYSTSGDWKSEDNNQPITVGDISVAVNGVLSMKKKSEYEKEYNVKCKTENDAEIFVQRLMQGESPIDFLYKLKGSFAGVFLYKGGVFAMRNNTRPLHWFKKYGAVFVVPTVDVVDRALKEKLRVQNIQPFTLFNLYEHL